MTVSPSAAQSALSVTGLHKRFGDVVAVDGLDLDVRQGECFGLTVDRVEQYAKATFPDSCVEFCRPLEVRSGTQPRRR